MVERFLREIAVLSRQDLRMKDEQRDMLKEAIGVLKKKISRDDIPTPVIGVGDITVKTLHSLGADMRVGVCDLKTHRSSINEFSNLPDELSEYERIDIVNPASRITRDAWSALKESIDAASEQGRKTLVVVKGEEDLLSLPAIALAPEDWTVAYGAPEQGIHLVKCDEKAKELAIKVLKNMKHED